MIKTWKIGGEAGFGIMVSGSTFSRSLARAGLYLVETSEYPSLIRGGHNTVAITFSEEPIFAPYKPVDLLVALNKETVTFHKDELSEGASILYDGTSYDISDQNLRSDVVLFSIPFGKLIRESGGEMIMRNTVALGASIAVLGLPFKHLADILTAQFSRKGEKVVDFNVTVAKLGYDYILSNYKDKIKEMLPKQKESPEMVVTGAEASGLGAIAAGVKFFAAYPMTPINALLTYMAAVQVKGNFIYKQPEDEIAAINMAVGASFSGARAMVATSGGGFSLMVEGTSLAGMTEQPVVIIMGMRPGPATGLPTWTGQADLHFVLNASQGEFPRIVLAPGDMEETFELTAEAFNLADRYQTPVFVLVDKYLFEARFTTDVFHPEKIAIDRGKLLSYDEQVKTPDHNRFALTEDGISPRGIPGRPGGVFRSNSDEHNEAGYSDEEALNTAHMIEKRMKKQKMAEMAVSAPLIYGESDAQITLIGWGSTKGAAREAIKRLSEKNIKCNYVQMNYLNPFPSESLEKILKNAKKVVDVEGNHNGQLADLIRMKTGIYIKDRILKYDGRPFYPEDIIEGIKHIV